MRRVNQTGGPSHPSGKAIEEIKWFKDPKELALARKALSILVENAQARWALRRDNGGEGSDGAGLA
jgi:hypothetical protein